MNRIDGACCLVTGGAGFIGSTIVDQLLDAGAARSPRARQFRSRQLEQSGIGDGAGVRSRC